MTGRSFIMNIWGFHDGRLIFSWWKVEMFMTTGWYFHDDRLRFSWWQVEVLLWTVEVFMMTSQNFIISSRNFHDDRSRFFWWKVKIFEMTGRGFYDAFTWRILAKFRSGRKASLHPDLMGNCQTMWSHIFAVSIQWIVNYLSVLGDVGHGGCCCGFSGFLLENGFIVKTSQVIV